MKNGIIVILLLGLLSMIYLQFVRAPSLVSSKRSTQPHGHGHDHGYEDNKIMKAVSHTSDYLTVKENNISSIDAQHELESEHSHIPADIKQKLCLLESIEETCTIDLATDFVSEVFDIDTGGVKASEISAIMSSTNYNEVINQLSLNKKSDEAYRKESDYNLQLNNIVADVPDLSSSGVSCDDQVCAASIQYINNGSFETFNERFFQANDGKGNLFISHLERTENTEAEIRIFFIPGSTAPVIRHIK